MSNILKRLNLRFGRNEISGSLGDLGIFLPLAAGLSARCGMNFGHILFFAGAMNITSGLIFGIPIPVQPMKVIAAVAIAEGLDAETIIAAGILAGAIILLLALTGLIDIVSKTIPKPVIRGLQLAIGIKLVFTGIEMINKAGYQFAPDSVFTAAVLFVFVLLSFKYDKIPGALSLFAFGIILVLAGNPGVFHTLGFGWQFPDLHLPSTQNFIDGFWQGTIPQIPLTILNSVIAVSALSVDLFPNRPLMPKRVAVSVSLMNLIACPFGGMPMCHGAGGLAAQYRFGARTGGSVVFLGLAKMILAVTFGGSLLAIISLYPSSVLGVMLLFAGWQMVAVCADMKTKSNIVLTALTAGVCLAIGTAAGFVIGFIFSLLLFKMIASGNRRRDIIKPELKERSKEDTKCPEQITK